MTITWTQGSLPEELFRAVNNDSKERVPGVEFSVTELLAPARMRRLLETNDVQVAATEKLWALIGKALHFELARHGEVTEQTLVGELEGTKISGTVDLIHRDIICDWKLCSVWSWILGVREEWEQQLNCYAWLYRRWDGRLTDEPKDLQVHMIFRDWHRSKANGVDYPATETHTVSLVIWPDDKATEFLRSRIRAHKDAVRSLPVCSDAERWHRPGGVAVMKQRQKKALRVLPTEEEAIAWAEQKNEGGLYLEPRPGKDIRCLDWCAARSVCDHARQLNNNNENEP
jgi:hypothetical protein